MATLDGKKTISTDQRAAFLRIADNALDDAYARIADALEGTPAEPRLDLSDADIDEVIGDGSCTHLPQVRMALEIKRRRGR